MADKGALGKAVFKVVKDSIGYLFGEETIEKVAASSKKSYEGAQEFLAGGERFDKANIRPIAEQEIQKGIETHARIIESAEKSTWENILLEKVNTKVSPLYPEVMQTFKSIEGGDFTALDTFVRRANSLGIPIQKDDITQFVNKNEMGLPIFPEDAGHRVVNEVIRPHYVRNAQLSMLEQVAKHHESLTNREATIEAVNEAFKNRGMSLPKDLPPDKITSALRNTSIEDLQAINKNMFARTSAARQIQIKELSEAYNIGAVEKLTMTFPDMLAKTYAYAHNNGLTEVAEYSKKLWEHQDRLSVLANRVDSMKRGLLDEWKLLEDKGIDKNVRQYMQEFDVGKTEKMFGSGGMFNDGYSVDREAAMRSGLLNELGEPIYGSEVFQTAIRTSNSFRYTRFLNYQIKTDSFEKNDLPQRFEDLVNGSEIPVSAGKTGSFSHDYGWTDRTFVEPGFEAYGDLGHNYFHIKLTEEHREVVRNAKELQGLGDNVADQQYGFQRMRRANSQARLDENRLKPTEELEDYFTNYMYSAMKDPGKEYIRGMRGAIRVYDPLAITDRQTSRNLEGMVTDIEGFYNRMFTAAPDPYDMGIITKAVTAITDLNTSLVMSVANPRMLFFNMWQDIQTTAAYKPFGAVLRSQGLYKDAAKFYVGGEGALSKRIGSEGPERLKQSLIKNLKDPEARDAIKYYFDYHNPDVLMHDLYDASPRVMRWLNFMAAPYQATDLIGRAKTISAAVDFARSEWDKAFANVAKNDAIAISKAKRLLTKQLHLNEFNALEVDSILSKVSDRSAFINEYAARSVNAEAFNYSRFNRPYFAELARTSHPILNRSVRFLSWNTYYLNQIKGAYRSFKNGDSGPMKQMATMSLLWFGSMKAAAGLDDDTINNWATYGLSRTPVFSPVLGLTTQPLNTTAGIAAPSIATILYPAIKTLDFMSDMVSNTRDEYDRVEEAAILMMKRQPLAAYPTDLIEKLFGGDKK